MMKKDPLLLLKLAVYGMGILLVCGFVWLGIRLTVKAGEMSSGKCSEITLPAGPEGSMLHRVAFEGGYWVMDYTLPGGGHVLLRYESCGKRVQKVTLP